MIRAYRVPVPALTAWRERPAIDRTGDAGEPVRAARAPPDHQLRQVAAALAVQASARRTEPCEGRQSEVLRNLRGRGEHLAPGRSVDAGSATGRQDGKPPPERSRMNETCHQKKRYFIAIVLHSARQRPRGDRLPRAFTAVAIVAMVGLFYTQQATSLSAGRQNPPVPQSP
jgi:hypothetical protein